MTSKRTEEQIAKELADNVRDNYFAAQGNCFSKLVFEYDELMRPLLEHCIEIIENNENLGLSIKHKDHALICETLKTYNLGRLAFYASRISFNGSESTEMLFRLGRAVDGLSQV
jgi:hypothetical protein